MNECVSIAQPSCTMDVMRVHGSTVLNLTGRLCKLSPGVDRGAVAPVTSSALSITLLLSSSRVSALHPITAKKQSAERVPHVERHTAMTNHKLDHFNISLVSTIATRLN